MSPEHKTLPFTSRPNGVSVAVRLTPKAANNRIGDIRASADGKEALRVWVTPPPESGKANTALIALLAKEWKMAKGDITIKTGARGRNKIVFLAGDPKALMGKLRDWSVSRERHG
ncbi:MAG: DUF167 domain-containing protein [Proteobacteria bacterium]|nr:DUF167 domain-containing protein [Pseudomonadota bacterium]